MSNRVSWAAASLIACSAVSALAQAPPEELELAAPSLVVSQQNKAAEAVARPTTVAHCGVQCGFVASTGNLYFTSSSSEEFEPDWASFYRISKTGTPGSEGLIYQETGDRPGSYFFGKPAYTYAGGMYYGYFAASYNDSGVQTSLIKRVPLSGGSAITLGYAPTYIGSQSDLLTDGLRLYWADSRGVRSMPIGGGAIQDLVSLHGTARFLISLRDNYLYYSVGRLIGRAPKAGGTPETITTAPNVVTALHAYAGSSTNILWGEQGGAIRSLTGTHQNPIPGVDVKAVGFDGTRMLWINCESQGNYCSVNARKGSEMTTVDGGAGARNLQWDATSMYWIGGRAIKRYVH